MYSCISKVRAKAGWIAGACVIKGYFFTKLIDCSTNYAHLWEIYLYLGKEMIKCGQR
ncbi:protein of unknown function [Desulfovibrio sp. 86]|nr:protein of unknown function [Desulfovibrio sp. 86]